MQTHAQPTDAALTDWLKAQIADYLSISPSEIEADVPLAQYGLDSVFALGICGDIEDRFNITVEPTLAWDYPTVALIAEFIRGEVAAAG